MQSRPKRVKDRFEIAHLVPGASHIGRLKRDRPLPGLAGGLLTEALAASFVSAILTSVEFIAT